MDYHGEPRMAQAGADEGRAAPTAQIARARRVRFLRSDRPPVPGVMP